MTQGLESIAVRESKDRLKGKVRSSPAAAGYWEGDRVTLRSRGAMVVVAAGDCLLKTPSQINAGGGNALALQTDVLKNPRSSTW